ncbi:MAG: PLDc N-terminal domain-containing protein [Deltaproteobacteria bacterium]|nr:PLDc N-terminal domain-containing protein [Deltaproteobacteria bacterium]
MTFSDIIFSDLHELFVYHLREVLAVHFLPTLGYLFALLLMSRILTERRSHGSLLAWIMAIAFIPYVGVPLYLMLGGRKLNSMAQSKPLLPKKTPDQYDEDDIRPLLPPGFHGSFPVTRNNTVVMLPSGEQAYDECMGLIESAVSSIYVATFILKDDDTGRALVDAMARRAAAGVHVRLLLDAFGSMGLSSAFLSPLTEAGGGTAFFMPMMRLPFSRGRSNLRNHRKMLIVDRKAAVMGGMNLAEEYMGPFGSRDRWQDLSVRVDGPVADQLYEIFRSDWLFASGEELEPARPAENDHAGDGKVGHLQIIASGPDVKADSLREAIINALYAAETRAWIVTPYFVPDQTLAEALCMAARRGVNVTMMLPRRSNHRIADLAREMYLEQLEESGGNVLLYQPGMLHAKAMLVDDRAALLGSANMDMRSLLYNYEVGLSIHDPEVIKQVDAWMGWLTSYCRPRQGEKRRRVRFLHGVGRLFAPLL